MTMSLGEIVRKITREKVWSLTYGIFSRTPRLPKFWHKYVMTYGDSMVIVKPYISGEP